MFLKCLSSLFVLRCARFLAIFSYKSFHCIVPGKRNQPLYPKVSRLFASDLYSILVDDLSTYSHHPSVWQCIDC